ncbi:hypothetical protein [Candidatus Viridilinea mediisalina]|uniref:hypothetical protein n=1 Tax=Candidatus Viridilinea mediisalina TaxID=2024553 RepID=UPI000F597D48|nr:hypothetical protein [Candidatus Viridilinea mediisalina]
MHQPAANFDGAWKEALEHYLPACLELLFPEAYAGIDWTKPVKDEPLALLQINPEVGKGKQYVDKLVRVTRLDGEQTIVFLHIEIQAQHDEAFAERMFCYNTRLFDFHELDIVIRVINLCTLITSQP